MSFPLLTPLLLFFVSIYFPYPSFPSPYFTLSPSIPISFSHTLLYTHSHTRTQIRGPLDIFLSHDWPSGVAVQGNLQTLLRKKSFLTREIQTNTFGNPPSQYLLSLLQPRYWFAAHIHVKYPAVVNHGGAAPVPCPPSRLQVVKNDKEEGEKRTKFLALDKVLPFRDFIQVCVCLYFLFLFLGPATTLSLSLSLSLSLTSISPPPLSLLSLISIYIHTSRPLGILPRAHILTRTYLPPSSCTSPRPKDQKNFPSIASGLRSSVKRTHI